MEVANWCNAQHATLCCPTESLRLGIFAGTLTATRGTLHAWFARNNSSMRYDSDISSSRAMSHALTFGGPTGTVSKGRILALSSDSKVSTQTSEDEKKCTQRRCRRSDYGVFAREHALQVYIHVRKQTQVYVRTDNYEEKDGAIHHL